ncbi:MAG: methyltransferase domain-containing protein [Acidobacteriota bacterium]
MTQARCIICGTPALVEFFALDTVPVHCNIQWEAREAARSAPSGDLRLVFCTECGHIFNRSFDPVRVEYSQKYENSLHFSPFFESYAQGLARRLVRKHGLAGKQILEIGCGKGEFLSFICGLAGSRGVGFDPSHVAENPGQADSRIRFVHEFYSADPQDFKPDLVICRHVLEHLPSPLDLLRNIRKAASGSDSRPVVFFEVPNVLFTLRDHGVWDLIYEHVSYFSPASLRRAFEQSGFEVEGVDEVYGGQFLQIEARPQVAPFAPVKAVNDRLVGLVEGFAEAFDERVEWWGGRLEAVRREGKRAVLWGAGSKGVTFLNTFKDLCPAVCAVDLNPRKHGRFLAGCGVQILAPEFLRELKPDLVLIANPLYQAEIRSAVADLGLEPEFAVI